MKVILISCLSPVLDNKFHEGGIMPVVFTTASLKLSLELTNNKPSKVTRSRALPGWWSERSMSCGAEIHLSLELHNP